MKDAYQHHVELVATELGCRMQLGKHDAGMMYIEWETPTITGPTIEDYIDTHYRNLQSKYIAVLHELGHMAYGHTQGRPKYEDKRFYYDNGVLRSEAQAWEFAMDACIDEIEPETMRFMRRCFLTYIRHALKVGDKPTRLWNGGRYHVTFVYDQPGEYVFSVLERMGGDRNAIILQAPAIKEFEAQPGNFHDHYRVLKVGRVRERRRKTIAGFHFIKDESGNIIGTEDMNVDEVNHKEMLDLLPMAIRERKGRRFLSRHLTPEQWEEYKQAGFFHLKCDDKTYLIHGYYGVQEVNEDGEELFRYCLHGEDHGLCQADVLLMQKVLLQAAPEQFFAMAHANYGHAHPLYDADKEAERLDRAFARSLNDALSKDTKKAIIEEELEDMKKIQQRIEEVSQFMEEMQVA